MPEDGSSILGLNEELKRLRVMVLNPDYTPVSFPKFSVSWRRAISMVELGAATNLRLGELEVHSPSITMPVPTVIVLKRFYKFSPLYGTAPFSLVNLYLRDRARCMYDDVPLLLGTKNPDNMATLDHVIPKSRGGPKTWLNSVLACVDANHRKANRTPAEAGMRLKYEPWTPTCADLLTLRLSVESLQNFSDDQLEFLTRVKPSKRVRRVLEYGLAA
jgi:5-methylcytosine-specific restriction endonuclease McrA